MPDRRKNGVLLMAYGSPSSLHEDDVRSYLTHILQFYRKTTPTDEEVQQLKARYEAVGGSPLTEITRRLADATQRALDAVSPDLFVVSIAMKHSPPFIEDVTKEFGARGLEQGLGVALAPFRSRLSTDAYYKLVNEANESLASRLAWQFVGGWHLHPRFLDLWQQRLGDALGTVQSDPVVVFTNHSLPVRPHDGSDPYTLQFEATAKALADRLGLQHWVTAFQSPGGGSVPWLGPTLLDVIRKRVAQGCRSLLVAPVGFLMEHLEVLYDLDVEAQEVAREMNIELHRTAMPNDDPMIVEMLVEVIRKAAFSDQRSAFRGGRGSADR